MSDIKAKLSAVEVLSGTPSIGKGEKGDKGDTGDITPEAQAALASAQQAAEAAKTSAQQAEAVVKSIPEIEIGGRNLLLDSEKLMFTNYTGTSSTTEENIAVTEWGTTDARRVYGTSGTSDIAMLIVPSTTFLPNQDYIGSIYIKNNHESTSLKFNRTSGQYGSSAWVEPGESKRISFQYNPHDSAGMIMQIHARCTEKSEFDFTYWRPQWEEGNKATSWTPAPEDIFNNAYLLDRINPVTSGSLNDYVTPGVYTCTNSTLGENIADQPDGKPKAGFKVVVEYVGHPSMILQTITYQGSLLHTYKRLRDGEIWKPWYGGPSNQWAAIGQLADLQTAEKGSLVGAINEVNTNLGNVSESGVYASGSTADPPIPLILDADLLGGQGPETYARQTDIETVSEAIPSPFRVRLVGNGRGALICPEDGIYLLLAGCRHDSSIYLEAIVSKHPNVNGGAPKVTVLKSAGMSVEATNSGGTIAVIADSTEDSLIRMCSIQFGSIT
jgi:hypothetical protein|nr:MAG TPA: hypothetical protein [Caudoviricetes sp.]